MFFQFSFQTNINQLPSCSSVGQKVNCNDESVFNYSHLAVIKLRKGRAREPGDATAERSGDSLTMQISFPFGGGGHFPSPDFNQDFASPDEILEILLGPHKFAKVCLSHCKMDKTINQQRLQMCLFSLHVNINEFDMNSDRSTIAASPG